MIQDIQSIVTLLSILITAVTTIWYIILKGKEIKQKRFEVYHSLLIKGLVQSDEVNEKMYIDRQIAIVFELRNFSEYYELSLRLLNGIYPYWEERKINQRLLDEAQKTIKYIEAKGKIKLTKMG